MLAAVIFDLDGLLVDSEDLHFRTWREVLAGLGVALDAAEYADHWIRSGQGIAEHLERHRIGADPQVLRGEKLRIYRERITAELRPMPGALELVEGLRPRTPLGLATSSLRAYVTPTLVALGLDGAFAAIGTFESVPRAKPHPDVFLHVARDLAVAPSQCVVLDDAEKGILAAHAAGMKVIAVPTPHTWANDFSRATLVVPSLTAITPDLIERLAGG